jgi:hypothetical protein
MEYDTQIDIDAALTEFEIGLENHPDILFIAHLIMTELFTLLDSPLFAPSLQGRLKEISINTAKRIIIQYHGKTIHKVELKND